MFDSTSYPPACLCFRVSNSVFLMNKAVKPLHLNPVGFASMQVQWMNWWWILPNQPGLLIVTFYSHLENIRTKYLCFGVVRLSISRLSISSIYELLISRMERCALCNFMVLYELLILTGLNSCVGQCRYKVIKEVGNGTFGSVWRALSKQSGEVVCMMFV